jgi:DNA polymerase III subunit epsilon
VAGEFLALRDRAFEFLAERTSATEDELLRHVFGGQPPVALRERLLAPLLDDPRLERRADGTWAHRGAARVAHDAYTVLAVVATGPTPGRAHVAHISALSVRDGTIEQRFSVTVNPGVRVPGYVADRLGVLPGTLEQEPPFVDNIQAFVEFFGERPIYAQDAHLTWAFVAEDARRAGVVLPTPVLIDVNDLAVRVLGFDGKPTLALVAQRFHIAVGRIQHPDEEARVLARLVPLLLQRSESSEPAAVRVGAQPGALRPGRSATPRAAPELPGVYVLRGADEQALYVGKARRLRSRLAAYVHRPLGTTRRLEGLVGSVARVDAAVCANDLEALVLEDREIRRLQPRFNSVRAGTAPRVWVHLPPAPAPRAGRRQPAWRKLELSLGPAPTTDGAGWHCGPFRNETAAERARQLARSVFDLDALRRAHAAEYETRLLAAWRMLTSREVDDALELLQQRQRAAAAGADLDGVRACERLIAAARAFAAAPDLLPADPRGARYAVVRADEAFVIDRGICVGWLRLLDDDMDAIARELLTQSEPRTTPEDADIVLRWLGAQPRLVHLADPDTDAEVVCSALAAREAAAPDVDDPREALI